MTKSNRIIYPADETEQENQIFNKRFHLFEFYIRKIYTVKDPEEYSKKQIYLFNNSTLNLFVFLYHINP